MTAKATHQALRALEHASHPMTVVVAMKIEPLAIRGPRMAFVKSGSGRMSDPIHVVVLLLNGGVVAHATVTAMHNAIKLQSLEVRTGRGRAFCEFAVTCSIFPGEFSLLMTDVGGRAGFCDANLSLVASHG